MAYPAQELESIGLDKDETLSFRNLELGGDESSAEGQLGQFAALASAGGVPMWVWAALGGVVVGGVGVWLLTQG